MGSPPGGNDRLGQSGSPRGPRGAARGREHHSRGRRFGGAVAPPEPGLYRHRQTGFRLGIERRPRKGDRRHFVQHHRGEREHEVQVRHRRGSRLGKRDHERHGDDRRHVWNRLRNDHVPDHARHGDTTHPLAAGLTGSPAVTSSAQTFTWGVPGTAAVKIATISGASTHCGIYAYDTGAAMIGGFTAPARRTGFFLQDTTASAWNTNGQALFDAAVRWTAHVPVTPVGVTASPGNAQVALTWTASSGAASYNVKRATASAGPYTTVG